MECGLQCNLKIIQNYTLKDDGMQSYSALSAELLLVCSTSEVKQELYFGINLQNKRRVSFYCWVGILLDGGFVVNPNIFAVWAWNISQWEQSLCLWKAWMAFPKINTAYAVPQSKLKVCSNRSRVDVCKFHFFNAVSLPMLWLLKELTLLFPWWVFFSTLCN